MERRQVNFGSSPYLFLGRANVCFRQLSDLCKPLVRDFDVGRADHLSVDGSDHDIVEQLDNRLQNQLGRLLGRNDTKHVLVPGQLQGAIGLHKVLCAFPEPFLLCNCATNATGQYVKDLEAGRLTTRNLLSSTLNS